MSVSGDLLASASPTRLLCRRGTWTLELVRLVAVDQNVFQPRVQRLEGVDAVLGHLKRSENPSLAAGAAQLLRARSDEDRAFEAVDGEWVPVDPNARARETPSVIPSAQAHSELASLRAELAIVRASHERLRERVARLEALFAGTVPHGSESGSASRVGAFEFGVARSSARRPEPEPEPGPVAAPAAETEAGPANTDAEADAAPPPAEDEAPQNPALHPPSVTEISACLKTLMGRPTDATEHKGKPVVFGPQLRGYFVARLLDDEGAEVGAIAADLEATILLGGTLLMLPEGELADQRKAKAPSEDVLSAMSEVMNNLSGVINERDGNPHVRITPCEALDFAQLAWLGQARRRLELELETGRLLIVGR